MDNISSDLLAMPKMRGMTVSHLDISGPHTQPPYNIHNIGGGTRGARAPPDFIELFVIVGDNYT